MATLKKTFHKIIFITILASINAVTLKCDFKFGNFASVKRLYYCDVQNNGIFNGTRVKIDSIEGEHLDEMTDDDVKGFYLYSIPRVSFIPQNITKFFENLIFIRIGEAELIEISESDMKMFKKLKFLRLNENKIKIIEKNVFKNNSELRTIRLDDNKISHIDVDAFNGLSKLSYLNLSNNKCGNVLHMAIGNARVVEIVEKIASGWCAKNNAIFH